MYGVKQLHSYNLQTSLQTVKQNRKRKTSKTLKNNNSKDVICVAKDVNSRRKQREKRKANMQRTHNKQHKQQQNFTRQAGTGNELKKSDFFVVQHE